MGATRYLCRGNSLYTDHAGMSGATRGAYRRGPRKRGASDARLAPLETPRRRRGLKVAVVQSALTGTALTRRPSPVVAASSRPSVCVRCPRHENLPAQGTKRSIPHFREVHEMRPREASGRRSEPRSGARVGVFVRRFRRLSCHGACREPQVGMAGDV